MSERLTSRNKMIAELFSDGEKLKAFYRFAVRNPHITLRDACQILILRPDATVCYGYDEWNEVGRWVKRGAKGISYYDYDGLRQFVYDASDTKGENRALFPIIPVEHLLSGLDELNDTSFADGQENDYDKIKKGVRFYLHEQGLFTGDEERDKFMCEGVAFSLYAQTGLSQGEEVTLTGLPFTYSENAEFVKEVYVQTAGLAQEIEDAYRNKKSEVSVIDDTEEETPTDEPINIKETSATLPTPPVEPKSAELQSFTIDSYYRTYLNVQKQYPQAIVFQRLGDFYEVMGENAKIAAEELDLTLTGRNVGLPDRIPMCGVPYHAVDKYVQKLLKNHSVIIVEPESEPIRILSEAEARGESAEEKLKLTPHEFPDDEPNPFDDEQFDEDDWRSELADELSDMDEREETNEEIEDEDSSAGVLNETSDTAKEKEKIRSKKPEQGIKDRKRKEKPPRSLFDVAAPQAQSHLEQVIEYELKRGSHVVDGKFRIFDKYNENPSEKAFAEFLKKEYGIGGSYVDNTNESHDAKGIRLRWKEKEHPENNFDILLKWNEVAVRIADLIDDDKYLTEQEKEKYLEYRIEQQHLREQRAEEARQKRELIDKVIVFAPDERKQRILDEYADTTKITEFAEFLKAEYGTSDEHGEGYAAVYNVQGIWISKGENVYDDPNRIYLNWNEFADKVCTLIENDKYFEAFDTQEETAADADKIKAIADRIVKEGTVNTTSGNYITLFERFAENEPFVRDHAQEIAEELESREEVSDVIVTLDGLDTNYYLKYCPNYEDIWHELDDEDDNAENTDLNAVLDQSELGGAKTRFKNNVAAIKLVNKLYEENRNPTSAERKVLAQFVGWGGLSQAFDESNAQWQKEYIELKGLLSQEDYEQARSSTLNAYYTAKDIIEGVYFALTRMGVKGNNRILEPAMGTGNFFGYMPQEIAEGARLYGVELDNLTGKIASKLYPQANVQIKGFEDTNFPNDKFDVIVGNVPFGGYGIADSAYNLYNFMVHDYFLAKSIDKVKPGGIVAIITSKGTMDKINPNARKYVAERAELLGAIRLPNTAFKQTAGTEAVADILFFQKRDFRKFVSVEDTEWLITEKTEEGYFINKYFISHPEMVLGTLAEEKGLYGGIDVTVKPDERNLKDALSEAIQNLPQGVYYNPKTPPEIELAQPEEFDVKPFCYKAVNGKLFMRVWDHMEEQRIPSYPQDAYDRIEKMIELREELHSILKLQTDGCSDEVLRYAQSRLNRKYDSFVQQYGNLNSQTNARLFKDDGDSALLFTCEDIDKDTGEVKKSDVFSKRTIRPYTVPTNTDDSFEALQVSKNERGEVDLSYIEELTGKDYDTVIAELGNAIFRDPELIEDEDRYSGFVTAEEYLSGKVVAKLSAAQNYVADHPEYQKNVDALLAVQPEPITASEISVRLGQTWVGEEYYKKFYLELIDADWYMQNDVALFYNPHDSSWRLDQKESVRRDTKMMQTEVYGTKRAPAYRLFMDCMNGRDANIFDTIEEDGKEKRVLNQAETIAAREKQNKIREEFQNWIFADPDRRENLERKYNSVFNQTRLASYDGSYLRFPEMNPAIELNPHQKNAIHRIIVSKESTLLHHVVGSGKTFTMIASIMKMRQLGLCKKAMVAVPNHLVEQWAGEWHKLYPNANILVATKEDLEREHRKRFESKVALGDWDGIIIAQSAFAKIGISKERRVRKLNEEIESIRHTLESRKKERMSGGAVKNLERIIKNKEKQLKKLMDDKTKDSVLIFENLGVDYLYIDEAHYYKNLFLYTKMNNVAGISTAASQRASDLKLKCNYLQGIHKGDRGVVFATGTPISNSMTEMYTMQTYLQPNELVEKEITFFDGWAADFGETVTSLELSPSGQGYRTRTRFSKFTNLPELQKMYRSFADVITSDMVKLNVPEAEKNVITLKPSETVIELAEEIAARADRIYAGGVDPHEDNMLKVTSDGKKLALDPRCFVSESADEQGSKLNEAAHRIYEIWEETTEDKGTQIVFCDLSTPKGKFTEYVQGINFDAYNELKYKLVQSGIPAEEIAFIHDANTDEQKQTLFDRVNSGAVRVLIGSTEKCGAGTNVQKRLVALHHLDTPYRPSDMEQREGRIIRQGNTNKKVQIYTYVMERTFDSYSYQILENKQRFISQICKGDFTAREYEDVDATTLSYAEIKAITAANPHIKRKREVDTEIIRLRVLEGQHKKNLYALQDKIRKDFPEEIRKQELLIERIKHDLQTANENRPAPDTFRINVSGMDYTDKKEGGRALMDALYASKPDAPVAEYCGFKISLLPITIIGGEREIALSGEGQYTLAIGDSASGNLTRIENFIEDLPARKERLEKRLMQIKSDLEIAEEQVKKPFEHAEKLSELLKEQAELNAELNLDKREQVIMDDGNGGEEENYKGLPVDPKTIMEEDIIEEKKESVKQPFNSQIELIKALNRYSEEEVSDMNFPAFDDELTVLDKKPSLYLSGDNKTYVPGLLLLHNETMEQWYVLNDTSAKNTAGKELEVGDKMDVETVLAYNGLYDGNPLREFYTEEEAREYFEEKRKTIHSIMQGGQKEKKEQIKLIDYEQEVKLSAQKEYDDFKVSMLSLSPEKVFEENYKIRAYNEFSSVIDDMEEYFSEDDYKALYRERGHILEHLYDDFLGTEGAALDSYDDTVAFMKDYCRHYHKDIYCNKPVYLQTAAYAHAHDQMEMYRASHGLSQGCKRDIDEAIRSNYDGMHLKRGFEDEFIKQYGLERVSYIVATTINEHDYDGRYSRENKEWAKTVPMSESEDERSGCCLNIHPAILDGFASMIRKKIKENQQEGQETMAQERQEEEEKYLTVTPQGHKVVSIIKDRDNRNIAILHRESHGDFVVAARYDPKDGKWAQGRYDFPTLEAAEKYRKEKYVNAAASAVIDEIKPEKSSIFIHVAREAQVAKHEYSTFFRMPTESEYAGYGYSIYNNRIKNSKQLVDLQSDTRELCYDIRLNEDETVKLTRSNGDEVELTARELMDEVSGTTAKDYEPKPRVTVMIPREAKGNVYDNSTMFSLPNSVSSERYTYFLPSRFVQEGEGENADKLILSIPEDFTVKAQNFDGDDMEYSAQKFIELCKDTTADDYYFDDDEENDEEEKATWFYVTVNDAAKITAYENSTLFKMPKGEYEGFTYYIPNGFLKEDTEKGTIRIGLPEDFVVRPKNMKTGEEINLSAEAFADHVRNKKLSAYRYLHRPSDEAKEQFSLIEQTLRKNVPEEMKARDNWVAITTFEKGDGKIGKRPIDCNTGKYAEADDSKTWTSFEKACKFARENGCVTIAYALDGEDKIACIDLDHCMGDNGDFTELASKTFQLGNGTYCERSLSGKGLHIFGKTEGSDLRSFSQDGDLEYYRSFRFIAMTGDNYGSSELKSFDNAPMKALLESKLQKREVWKGTGMGVEGLSLMGDREVYEKACSAYNGERFKALFEGQDLQNNHSNSDMSLMHYLAFWCNGDKDQMLRMFSSSGLFRRNKSPEYYEYTANKAIETTPERYTPKVQSAPKKPASGNNSGGNGKR